MKVIRSSTLLIVAATLIALSSCISAPTTGTAANPSATSPNETEQSASTAEPTVSNLEEQTLVVFDDDGSPDGTSALVYLLVHPNAWISSASISFGEAHPEIYIQHVGRILDDFGISNIPLGTGQGAPLAGNNKFPERIREAADNFYGLPIPNSNKTYPVQNAAELMVSVINGSAKPVTVFISGPCTNFAQALRLDPSIKEKIVGVYIMGGAVNVSGNIDDLVSESDNVVAEWNIYGDPQAAAEVFASGLEIYLVPLDATNQVLIDKEDIRQWRQGGEKSDFAADIYEMIILPNLGGNQAMIWDLMTAVIMVKPDLCSFERLHLDVSVTWDENSGQTLAVQNEEPNINVCLQPNVLKIKQTLVDIFSQN